MKKVLILLVLTFMSCESTTPVDYSEYSGHWSGTYPDTNGNSALNFEIDEIGLVVAPRDCRGGIRNTDFRLTCTTWGEVPSKDVSVIFEGKFKSNTLIEGKTYKLTGKVTKSEEVATTITKEN